MKAKTLAKTLVIAGIAGLLSLLGFAGYVVFIVGRVFA